MAIIATMERRAASIADADDRWYLPYSDSSADGVEVTADTAMTLSAWWCGVNILANAMGVLPLKLYLTKKGGGRELARDHYLFRMLHRRPNRWMTAFEFRSMSMGHLLTRGNFFAQKVIARDGRLLAVVPLNPTRVTVVVTEKIRYKFTPLSGEPQWFDEEEILHLRGLSSNGVVGLSPITAARQSLGMALAAQRHGVKFFENFARPGGVLRTPGPLTKEQRNHIRISWAESQGGENILKPAVLEGGLEWQAIGVNNEDAQWLGSLNHSIVDVARWLNMPPHKLKELSRATFSNIEHQGLEFVVDTILPWAENQEQRYDLTFLTEEEQDQGYYFKYSIEALLRGDSASKAAFYSSLFNMASISPNEIREKEEMDPVEGGDQRFVQMNLIPLERAGNLFGAMGYDMLKAKGGDEDEGADEEGEEEGDQEKKDGDRGAVPLEMRRLLRERSLTLRRRYRMTYEALFRDTASRIVKKETRAVGRIITSEFTTRSIPSFVQRLLDFYAEFQGEVRDAFLPLLSGYMSVVGASAAEEVNSKFDKDDEVSRFVRYYAEAMAARHVRSSKGQLQKLVDEAEPDQLDELLRGRLAEWEEKRPGKMANREVVQAGGAFADMIYVAAGFGSVWVASGGACPICQEMDGRSTGPQESFLNEGQTVDPGDGKTTPLKVSGSVRHPPLHEGCECDIAAAI
jgi:HK97 family phage portal protein